MLIPHIQLRADSILGSLPGKGPIIGLLLQSTFLVQLLISPRWGRWADQAGRKRVFILCQIISAVAMLIYGVANSILLLFASRILAGMGAANVSTGQAIASGWGDEKERVKVLGRISAALSSGMIFGPGIGGLISDSVNSAFVGFIGAAISGIGGLLVLFFVPNDTHSPEVNSGGKGKWFDFSIFGRYPLIKPFFWIAACGSFALGTLEGTFGRLIKSMLGYDSKEFGLIFSYEAVLGVLMGAFLLGWISRRLCETTVLRWAYVLQGLGLALNPLAGTLSSFAPGLFWLFVASTLYGLGAGAINPTLSTLVSELVPEDQHGEMFGQLQSARMAGFLVGPLMGGVMFDFWHPMPYVFAGLVCLAVALFLPAICNCHPGFRLRKN
jgi:MFS family permease